VTDDADKELTRAKSAPNRIARIRVALEAQFAPSFLDVIDESGLHAGHSGAAPGETTHVRVRMTSAAFAGQTRVARQRAVNAALAAEFAAGLHALALDLAAPERDSPGGG